MNGNKKCDNCLLKYHKLENNLCRLCSMIATNDKKKYMDEIILCVSQLSQNEIICKTIEYIKKNNKIPYPNIIDPNVLLSNIPLYQYNKQKNIKIFVTNLFDYSYLNLEKFGDGFIFLDNDYKITNNFESKLLEKYLLADEILNLKTENKINIKNYYQ